MQKIINVIAIASGVVSLSVMGSVTGALPDVVGGSLPGSTGPAVPSTEFDMPKF